MHSLVSLEVYRWLLMRRGKGLDKEKKERRQTDKEARGMMEAKQNAGSLNIYAARRKFYAAVAFYNDSSRRDARCRGAT